MAKRFKQVSPPKGIARFIYRVPVWAYCLHMGWLFGRGFLLLSHTGRKTGKERKTVLEIVDYDPETDTYYVAAAFGKQSDWYQNILRQPNVSITVRRKALSVEAVPLSSDESEQKLVDYARHHPGSARLFLRVTGYRVSGQEEEYRTLGREHIPFVAFRPPQK